MTVECSFFSQPFERICKISVCIFLDMFTYFYVCSCLCVYLSMFLCVCVCACARVCMCGLIVYYSFFSCSEYRLNYEGNWRDCVFCMI